MTISLVSPLAKSQELDLKSYSHEERDEIALQLEDREVCHRDLQDTRSSLNQCSAQAGDSNTATHMIVGGAIGIVLGIVACGLTKACK